MKTPSGPILLETVHLAGRRVTSREAVQRFLRRVAEAKDTGTSTVSVKTPMAALPAQRHVEAKAQLDLVCPVPGSERSGS